MVARKRRVGGSVRQCDRIKTKVLEAMACSVPCVVTPLGKRGLVMQTGAEVIVAEERSIARSVLDLFASPAGPPHRSRCSGAGPRDVRLASGATRVRARLRRGDPGIDLGPRRPADSSRQAFQNGIDHLGQPGFILAAHRGDDAGCRRPSPPTTRPRRRPSLRDGDPAGRRRRWKAQRTRGLATVAPPRRRRVGASRAGDRRSRRVPGGRLRARPSGARRPSPPSP